MCYVTGCVPDVFGGVFRGRVCGAVRGDGREKLDELADSFHFDECVQREGSMNSLRHGYTFSM